MACEMNVLSQNTLLFGTHDEDSYEIVEKLKFAEIEPQRYFFLWALDLVERTEPKHQ